jgi:hypothetical protein
MPELPKIRDKDIQITRTLLSLLGYRATKVREGGPKKAAGRIIGSARMGVATKDKQIQYLQLMGYKVDQKPEDPAGSRARAPQVSISRPQDNVVHESDFDWAMRPPTDLTEEQWTASEKLRKLPKPGKMPATLQKQVWQNGRDGQFPPSVTS